MLYYRFGVVFDGSLIVPFGEGIISFIFPKIPRALLVGRRGRFANIGLFFLKELRASISESGFWRWRIPSLHYC